MREGEIELMTHDVLSSVSVLDVEAPAVTQLLTAAGCDVASVAAYCRNIAQTSQNAAQDAPQGAPQDARPALRLVADTARGFRAQITADVEPAYRALPPSTLATVRAAAPPGLFRCRVAAHALAPATPSLSRVPVCTQCQRPAPVDSVDGSSTGSAKCATCGTPLETRRVLQLRIGDRTGLLDVLVCDPPSVVCSFLFIFLHVVVVFIQFAHASWKHIHTQTQQDSLLALIETEGKDEWSCARAWLQPTLVADAAPYLDCALVAYTAPGGTTRHKLVGTVFRACDSPPVDSHPTPTATATE